MLTSGSLNTLRAGIWSVPSRPCVSWMSTQAALVAAQGDSVLTQVDNWGIENKLHYVRDVSCREHQSRTNAGHAPQVLAAVRNTALALLHRLGFKPVEGFEHFAEYRQAATDVVFGRRTE